MVPDFLSFGMSYVVQRRLALVPGYYVPTKTVSTATNKKRTGGSLVVKPFFSTVWKIIHTTGLKRP